MTTETSCIVDLPTRRTTRLLAERLAASTERADLLVLTGPLGAGKTFLVRALARALGLPPGERVTSPTFALVQELPTQPLLIHADLYRLQAAAEVFELGLTEARPSAVLVVEWGEAFIDALGGDALVIELSRAPRRAQLRATGPRARRWLAELQSRLPLPAPRRIRFPRAYEADTA